MTQQLESARPRETRSTPAAEPQLTEQLQSQADAVVVIPHTEGKTLATIQSENPDAIEIYNFHANVDPKIRHNDLGLPPFEDVPGMLTYLFDP